MLQFIKNSVAYREVNIETQYEGGGVDIGMESNNNTLLHFM